jgi:hypothetical protein
MSIYTNKSILHMCISNEPAGLTVELRTYAGQPN